VRLSKILSIVASAPLFLAGALADGADAPAAPKPAPSGVSCGQILHVTGFDYIDEQHVVLLGGPGRKFLLTLYMKCANLRDTLGISLVPGAHSQFGQVCSGDSIRVHVFNCQITSVEPVASTKEAQDLVAARDAASKTGSKP
jgi:Family of unknown function (DUF6491)